MASGRRSSHYTLVDLRNLCIPATPEIKKALALILATSIGPDGGINPSKDIEQSDVCINGMFLNYGCYFGTDEEKLRSVVDFIVSQQLADGGFNCRLNRSGARHSSMHSTISVLEGIREYIAAGYTFRAEDHHPGEVHFQMEQAGKPSRWNTLRCLRVLEYYDRDA